MPTSNQTYIHVPALTDRGRLVIPEFRLTENVEHNLGGGRDYFHTAAEHNTQKRLPTLAELRHAYFEGSEDYRRSVISRKGYREYTSTFLQDGERIIERPENIVYRNGIWVLEGGKVTRVKLPFEGWVLEYDISTGLPKRTSQNKKDAWKVFGDDASRFWGRKIQGVKVIVVGNDFTDSGPFCIDAYCCDPGYSASGVGSRECRR